MEQRYDAGVLKEKLDLMSGEQQLAFGAACCTRLLPNYLAFQDDSGWGDIRPLRNALDVVWDFLDGQAVSAENIERLAASCEAISPDSDDFTSSSQGVARDACDAICGLLEFLLDRDVWTIVHAATYATNAVDIHVEEIEELDPEASDVGQRILTHPLMQRELKRQREDLAMLAQARLLDASFLTQLRGASVRFDRA